MLLGTNATVEKMKATATELADVDMLSNISQYDDVSHIYYHKFCKTKLEWRCQENAKRKRDGAWYLKRQVRSDAYNDLCSFIHEHVLENNQCIFYLFIKDKYVELLKEQYEDASNSKEPKFFTTRNLEKQLLATFNKKIKIIFISCSVLW